MSNVEDLLEELLKEVKEINQNLKKIASDVDWAQHYASNIETNTSNIETNTNDINSKLEMIIFEMQGMDD